MQVSKAFRCTMPGLRDDQADNLRRWAELHCAQSAVFRDDRGSVVLVGLKDELRSSASFARTVRTALSARPLAWLSPTGEVSRMVSALREALTRATSSWTSNTAGSLSLLKMTLLRKHN